MSSIGAYTGPILGTLQEMEEYKKEIVAKAVATSFLCHVIILTMYFSGVPYYGLIGLHGAIMFATALMGFLSRSTQAIVNFLSVFIASMTVSITSTQLPVLSGMLWKDFVPYWIVVCLYSVLGVAYAVAKYMLLVHLTPGTVLVYTDSYPLESYDAEVEDDSYPPSMTRD